MIIHNTEFQVNNLDNLINLIHQYIKIDRISDLYVILPTGKWQRKLQNDIVKEYFSYHKKPTSTINVYNLQKFTELLFDRLFIKKDYYILSEAYRLAMFEDACNSADIEFFGSKNSPINLNLINRLAQTIFGLKEDGITVNDLEKDVSSYQSDNANNQINDISRMKDILRVYKKYEELLGDKFLDSPALINKLSQKLNELNQFDPNKIKEIAFDNNNVCIIFMGFTDFKKPEIEFLSQFGFCNIPLAINLDFSIKNGPLCGNLFEVINWLTETGKFVKKDDISDITSDNDYHNLSPDDFLRKYLFVASNKLEYKKLTKIIDIWELKDLKTEVKYVSKYIKKLILNGYCSASEIAVVSRNPQTYASLFRDAFALERIPVNISDRFELKSSPVITLIFNILDLLVNDYHRNTYLRLLQNPLIDFNSSEIDIQNLIYVLSNFKVVRKPWIPKLVNKIEFIKRSIQQKKSDKADSFEIFVLENDLKKYEKALVDFKVVESKLPHSEDYTYISADVFSELIKTKIIAELGIINTIKAYYQNLYNRVNLIANSNNDWEIELEEIEKLSRASTMFLNLLDEMAFVLNNLYGNKQYTLSDLTERLKIAVSASKFNIKEKMNFGVEITSIEQIRGIPYKVLFLCGAYEDNFPLSFRTDSFIGKDIPNSRTRHYNSEQVQFYQFLSNGNNKYSDDERKTIITYPKFIDDSELVKSHFINALLKISDLGKCNIHSDEIQDDIENYFTWANILSNRIEIEEHIIGHLPAIDSEILVGKYFNLLKEKTFNDTFPEIQITVLNKNEISNKFSEIIEKPKSVSDFERYSDCAYKHFVTKFLKLSELPSISNEITPLETGDMIHNILFQFYKQIADNISANLKVGSEFKSLKIIKLNPSEEKSLYELLLTIAHSVFTEFINYYPFFDLFYFEMMGFEFKNKLENFPSFKNNEGKLSVWLTTELRRAEGSWGFYPFLFEFSFGFNKANQVVDIESSYKLRGRIDRIELLQFDDKQYILVADYKTKINNTKHSAAAIKKGKSYQMPLYLYAAKQILNQNYNLESEYGGAVYYAVKDFSYKNKNLDNTAVILYNSMFKDNFALSSRIKESNIDILLDIAIENTRTILQSMKDGKFNVLSNKGKYCEYCNFISVCKVSKNLR